MNVKKITKILFLLPTCFITLSALAMNLEEFGDFSSRSLIMNENNQKNIPNQEEKNILKLKELSLNTVCLNEQIKKNKLENVILLLDLGVNPNKQAYSEYPTYLAAKYNRFEILKELINHGAKLDKSFYSELYIAIKNKNKQMAQYLIDNKANVNYTDSVSENTIVYESLRNKMYDITEQLIEKGAKPDIKSLKYIKKKKLYYLIENK